MQRYSIQFNNKTISLFQGDTEKIFFLLLAVAVGLSCFLYLFFVGTTIFNIVERNNLESQNRELSSRVGELELLYLSESNKIDINLAYSLGFKDAVGTVFASANNSGKGLSLAENN